MQKEWWNNARRKSASADIDATRKKLGVIAFSVVGGTTCLLFGLLTPSQSSYLLRAALVFCALYLYINALALHFHHNHELSLNLCGCGIIPPALVIVASGGYENTGLYWVYPFLISIFMFLGHKKGMMASLLLYGVIIVMCLNQEYIDASYSSAEVSRFLASFFVCMLLCFSTEFFRFRSFNRLAILNLNRQKLANTDALTNLPNRRFIDAEFMPLATKEPEQFFPLVAVVIDIDFFKKVNDTYGHAVGDKILVHIANCFRSCIRESDVISRTGGEEFLLLIPNARLSIGISVTEKIRQLIEQTPFIEQDLCITTTISAGVAVADSAKTIDSTIEKADLLMYEAKKNGRNKVQFKLNDEA